MNLGKVLKDKRVRKTIFIFLIIVFVAASVYLIVTGRHYFSRRSIRSIQHYIRSFGAYSPMVVLALIFISTAIPPLPLPIPLIEVAAGLAFGFLNGFLVVWLSQVVSSLFAFYISRLFRNTFIGKLIKNYSWQSYQHYLDKRGSLAVLLTRITMSAPFNMISFMAGISKMHISKFMIATILGTIPEAVLFSFVGSRLRNLHVSLWYLLILVVGIGLLGFFLNLFMMRILKPKLETQKQL